MSRFEQLRASFILFLLAWGSACHKRQVAVPVAVPPASVQAAPVATPAPPTAATDPPAPSITTHPEDPSKYQVNKAPQAAPAAKKPTRPATTPVSTTTPQQTPALPPPAPTPPAPPVAAAPPPKLGDVLSADEQKQLNSSIDQSLAHAQTSLNAIGSRQLNKDQQVEVQRVRDFIRQAQSTRGSDPAGAKSLAERAEVLARDLTATFH